MFERITPLPESQPVERTEKKVSSLERGDTVIRGGETCTITSYKTNAANEVEMTFSNGDQARLDLTDMLEVPA